MNPYANPRAYQEQAILTATPGQLVVLLYDGIVRFLRQADAAFEAKQVAQNLEGIYVFWKGCFMDIRLKQDREKLQRIVAQVANLREAWAQIAQSAEGMAA